MPFYSVCKRPLTPGCVPCRRSHQLRSGQHRLSCHAVAANSFGLPDSASDHGHEPTEGQMHRTEEEIRRAKLRAKLFFTLSMGLAIPLFFLMSVIYPVVMLLDRYRRRAEDVANKMWAVLSTLPFVRVQMEGLENMPGDSPAVFVANHESYMDIFSLFHLGKDIKFVSKRSIFSIPFVGWSMWLTGHVALDREDAAGFRAFVKRGRELLENGASLAIFPEGTRSMDGRLGAFKKGAFTIATKARASLIPVTILGSGDVMPSGREGELHPGTIRLIVHPPISTKGKKTTQVAEECRQVISSRLPAWKLS